MSKIKQDEDFNSQFEFTVVLDGEELLQQIAIQNLDTISTSTLTKFIALAEDELSKRLGQRIN